MSRLFDGTNDQVQWALGNCNLTGAYTFVSVIKLDAGVSWQGYLGNDHATTGSEIAQGRYGISGTIMMAAGGGAGGTPNAIAQSSTDGWHVVAGSRPAGAGQTVRLHKGIVGGAWTHTDGATLGNPLTQAGGKVVFGQIDGADFFKGRLAVAAEFAVALSDGELEGLLATFLRASWLNTAGIVGLWDEIDAFAVDHTGGGADQTLLTGTTDDADDPAGWDNWDAPLSTVDVDYSRFPKPKLARAEHCFF